MSECKGIVAPKLDKACIDGDNEELSDKDVKVQIFSACFVVSQQQENGHSKRGATVVYEVEKSDSVGNETVETTLEVCQGHRGHVNCV